VLPLVACPDEEKAMTNQERAQKLEDLICQIIEARDTFHNETAVCPSCGAERFLFWNDRQMRDQLNGAVTRLTRVVERMKNTENVEEWKDQRSQNRQGEREK
jgi:hypothetical protein